MSVKEFFEINITASVVYTVGGSLFLDIHLSAAKLEAKKTSQEVVEHKNVGVVAPTEPVAPVAPTEPIKPVGEEKNIANDLKPKK